MASGFGRNDPEIVVHIAGKIRERGIDFGKNQGNAYTSSWTYSADFRGILDNSIPAGEGY
jgi:hypothetical protein